MKRKKIENIIREIVIYTFIPVFLLMSLRILIWKWLFWIENENGNGKIKKFHKQMNKINHTTKQ